MTRLNSLFALIVCGLAVMDGGVLASAAAAADHVAAIAPYVNDDTFVAGYLDLAALPQADANGAGKLLDLLPQLSDDAQAWLAMLKGVGNVVESLRAAGVDAVYAVAGLGDVNSRGGPAVIFHVGGAGQPETVARILNRFGESYSGPAVDVLPAGKWLRDLEVRPHGTDAVLVGTPATLDRYTSLTQSNRDDLTGPLEKLASEGAVVAAVFCPGPDFRRVVRELWPELPGPLAPLRGELADRWLHLEAAVNLPPDVKPRLALQASEAEAAETFVTLLNNLPAAVEELTEIGERRHELRQYLQAIVDAVPAQREGARVALTLPADESQLAKLQSVISGAADAAQENARRQRRMNQFKQLALAILNYADVNKHLPPAAICGKDGRPLLSWRVAILPFVEDNLLYAQFHLDEPWDSPHNRTLIEKMPVVFADPNPKLRQLAREGKTTFQVPVGPETVFHNNVGTTFREITDGTSQTIMIVEVEPLRAVVWTKPEDWEVDLQNPRRGVERTDRTGFVAARCDGSAHYVPNDSPDNVLRALLTRAGREVIERP